MRPNSTFEVRQKPIYLITFVVLGSTDGRIHVWRAASGEKLTTFTTDNSSDCIQSVQFNPKSFMLATVSTNMVSIELRITLIQFFSSRYFGYHRSMTIRVVYLIMCFLFFVFICVQYSYYYRAMSNCFCYHLYYVFLDV